MLEDQE